MLCSSVEPPDMPTRTLHRTNVKTFMQTVLAWDLVHNRLTNYMWNSQLAQAQQDCRKRHNESQIQQGELVYAGDVDGEQAANRDATNTTRRVNRKKKRAEVKEGTEEDGQ
jgi:hypothetical protein